MGCNNSSKTLEEKTTTEKGKPQNNFFDCDPENVNDDQTTEESVIMTTNSFDWSMKNRKKNVKRKRSASEQPEIMKQNKLEVDVSSQKLKIPLTSFKIHPKYDIAVAKFDNKILREKQSDRKLCRKLIRNIPSVGKADDYSKIEIAGFTCNGIQLVSKINPTTGHCEVIEFNHSEVIIYDYITTFMGQSGAPIFQTNGKNRELIGIHVGKYYNIKTGVGLSKTILEWINKTK